MPRTTAVTAAPLGSLTRPGARIGRCTQCGSERVTQLTMTLTDGTPVDFESCHRCEHRRWTAAGDTEQVLGFDAVIDRTRKIR